jgi:hypothetical protein
VNGASELSRPDCRRALAAWCCWCDWRTTGTRVPPWRCMVASCSRSDLRDQGGRGMRAEGLNRAVQGRGGGCEADSAKEVV